MKYSGKYKKEISFPLGGIGTGSIGIDGGGRLVDWEIFNKPSKGSVNGHSHFAIRALQGDKITAKVLNGDIQKDFIGQYKREEHTGYGWGASGDKMCGFSHFENVEFTGEFSMAFVEFKDKKFPANVNMTAFNPFIPGDSENSSIPAAFFEIEVENITSEKITYQVALSVANPYKKSINKSETKDGFRILTLLNNGAGCDEIDCGDLTLATDCEISSTQTYWYRGEWGDDLISFWNDFSNEVNINERMYDTEGEHNTGTLIAEAELCPAEKKKLKFILAWNSPNNHNYWDEYKNEDGTFYGWEGVSEVKGLCEGTCQHVWNYAYALCFLFPDLERSIRDAEFEYSLDENGRMVSRMNLPLGREMFDFRPCFDGQMGTIFKYYREWMISGDNEWLR